MPTCGKRDPKNNFETSVFVGVPDEPDIALGAQPGDHVQGSSWEGRDTTHLRAISSRGSFTSKRTPRRWEQAMGGQALRAQPRRRDLPYPECNNYTKCWKAGISCSTRHRRRRCYPRSARWATSTKWASSASSVFTTQQVTKAHREMFEVTHRASATAMTSRTNTSSPSCYRETFKSSDPDEYPLKEASGSASG